VLNKGDAYDGKCLSESQSRAREALFTESRPTYYSHRGRDSTVTRNIAVLFRVFAHLKQGSANGDC
jgi:hypothetical protein